MKTGVYYHPLFHQNSWPVIGDKFRHFPGVMEELLNLPSVKLIQPEMVSEELLLQVHTTEHLQRVQREWYYHGAALSVGGCVGAVEKVFRGELQNAFVFDVAAGHHAGASHAWGGTYLSCTGPAVANLRKKEGRIKVAILDTDSHHGDGTRDIFSGDPFTLHVCFCSTTSTAEGNAKICVDAGWCCSDEEYLEKVRNHFFPAIETFSPELVIHLLGHDTCRGDYGDRGLSPAFFPELVRELKEVAGRICSGKLVVASMGGADPELTRRIIPPVIEVLAIGDIKTAR